MGVLGTCSIKVGLGFTQKDHGPCVLRLDPRWDQLTLGRHHLQHICLPVNRTGLSPGPWSPQYESHTHPTRVTSKHIYIRDQARAVASVLSFGGDGGRRERNGLPQRTLVHSEMFVPFRAKLKRYYSVNSS